MRPWKLNRTWNRDAMMFGKAFSTLQQANSALANACLRVARVLPVTMNPTKHSNFVDALCFGRVITMERFGIKPPALSRDELR